MAFYPYYRKLREASKSMTNGNFGLWYSKLIPLNNPNDLKPSDDFGKDNGTVDYYCKQYNTMKTASAALLNVRHLEQNNFLSSFGSADYEAITITARLISPLITGIGETHPHEVSMVFDHNMGIPYIPSSGVKGIVRFAHTLSLISKAEEIGKIIDGNAFNDEEEWTNVPQMFGTQKKRGRIIFLDAYPEKTPELHIDIMNPHYAPYYGEEKKPPADHHQLIPIKFLTVKIGTGFVFRAVAERKDNLVEMTREAFIRALTEEGVGAKTAVGYGRFEIAGEKTYRQTSVSKTTEKKIAITDIWKNAYLSWNPGNQMLTATSGNSKASIRGKEQVPSVMHKQLFEKRKSVVAEVTVEKAGNSFIIKSIEAEK
jgi:CRISPR-associated protein Cmr6